MAKPSNRRIRAVASRKVSFGSGLDEIGFKPLGRRIEIRAGIDHLPLAKSPSTLTTGKRRD